MKTLVDAIASLDSASTQIVAALKANGAAYLNSDGGSIWLLTVDSSQFSGFRATPVPKASDITLPDVPAATAAPAATP